MGDRMKRRTLGSLVLSCGAFAACYPYAVHSDGHTLAPSTAEVATIAGFGLSNSEDFQLDSSDNVAVGVADLLLRIGITENVELGGMIHGFGGFGASVKVRHSGSPDPFSPAAATIWAFSASGQHHFYSATYVRSLAARREASRISVHPYWGVRGVQATPVDGQPVDDPVVGLFGGTRLGSGGRGVTLELGIFRERSVFGDRRVGVVVVPSISFRGPPPRPR